MEANPSLFEALQLFLDLAGFTSLGKRLWKISGHLVLVRKLRLLR